MRVSRHWSTAFLATILLSGSGATAVAGPSPASVTVEAGVVADVAWDTCTPEQVSVATASPATATKLPSAGLPIGNGAVDVTAVEPGDGVVTWTLAPTAEYCPPGATEPTEQVTLYESLRARWNTRRYVLSATEQDGVKRIAGWNVDYSRGSWPTVVSARKYFGRPSSIKGGKYQDCQLTWRHLALEITFVNYGIARPCSEGYAQYGRIRNPGKWAVKVGTRPGIVETSAPAYLVDRGRASEVKGGWELAEYYSPIGDPGYYTAVAALGSDDKIRSYDFWIGAGGD